LLTAGSSGARALRAALADAGYTDEAVAEPRRLHRFLPPDEVPSVGGVGGTNGRLSALVRLLTLVQPLPILEARSALAPAVLEDLQAVGLLTLGEDEVTANYCVVPHGGLLLTGDRSGEGAVISFTRSRSPP
jgi:hypothetical protein